ncbi:MAG: hypothetical protein AMS25_03395 [Gemmatimonas sp. SM23_52]|nr:MAG: hypothetical protein AMS25_03395 [Gemmatimonas sp. SM23_52]
MSTIEYLSYLLDAPRVEAFRRAIEATVRPGQVVLDLGTGIGTYAMFAARAGARVLAVEVDPVIEIARGLAADNGLADRITFLSGRVEALQAPERADVLIFEDFCAYLFHPETAEILEDVGHRWLAAEALAIPQTIRVMLAPVCSQESHGAIAAWDEASPYGLDIRRFTRAVLNDLHAACWGPGVLLGEPFEVARVDPLSLAPFGFDVAARWNVEREGVLHGLGLWIDLELAGGVSFSNRPSGRASGWNQMFLPVLEARRVRAGDVVEAQVATLGSSPRRPQWWRWRVETGGDRQEMDTFRGVPLSLSRLRRAILDNRPALTPRGQIRRAVLELMDGQRTVAEIAGALRQRFPQQLRRDADGYQAVARELEAGTGEVPTGQLDRPVGARLGR